MSIYPDDLLTHILVEIDFLLAEASQLEKMLF